MKQILYVNRMRNPLYNKTTRNNVLYDGPIYEQIDNELKIYNIDRKSAECILENRLLGIVDTDILEKMKYELIDQFGT